MSIKHYILYSVNSFIWIFVVYIFWKRKVENRFFSGNFCTQFIHKYNNIRYCMIIIIAIMIIIIIFQFLLWSHYLSSLCEDRKQVVLCCVVVCYFMICFSTSHNITSIIWTRFVLVCGLYLSGQFSVFLVSWDFQQFSQCVAVFIFLSFQEHLLWLVLFLFSIWTFFVVRFPDHYYYYY